MANILRNNNITIIIIIIINTLLNITYAGCTTILNRYLRVQNISFSFEFNILSP
jgi:hypothetical protein